MTAPNMATITASLERSMQNFSLNHNRNQHHQRSELAGTGERSSSSDDTTPGDDHHRHHHHHRQHQYQHPSSDTALELNSHLSLPYQWEQCLDLKTGEIYYINWGNGMKATEDPRTTTTTDYNGEGDFYSEDDTSYDSEESSSESSPPSSSTREHYRLQQDKGHVLVVAGCKGCLMYFMVPKQVEDCPKCSGQLLHFDRSENGSP